MANPIQSEPLNTRVVSDYTPATGFGTPASNTTVQVANLPVDSPPQLIGIDAVPFNVSAAGTLTLTFNNLVNRNNRANPLNPLHQNSGSKITIDPSDKLIFVCYPQGTSFVACEPIVIDKNNLRVPGPFLGGNTYLTWQVIVTTTGPASGMIVGELFFQAG